MRRTGSAAALLLIAVLTAEAPLHAYLDPGSTSLMIQGIVGGIAAGLVILKTYWHRITGMFRGSRGGRGGSGSAPPE